MLHHIEKYMPAESFNCYLYFAAETARDCMLYSELQLMPPLFCMELSGLLPFLLSIIKWVPLLDKEAKAVGGEPLAVLRISDIY